MKLYTTCVLNAMIRYGSKWGGSHARRVSVPPRFGAWASAGAGPNTAAVAPTPASWRISRRVRDPGAGRSLMTPCIRASRRGSGSVRDPSA